MRYMLAAVLELLWRRGLDRLQRRWSIVKPPTPALGVLAFRHAEFGVEHFVIDVARYNLYEGTDGFHEFVVHVEAGVCTKPSELQKVATGSPFFEATAILPPESPKLYPGTVISQAEGYDRSRQTYLSNMYYLRHARVDELRCEIHSINDEGIDATLTGCCVVNGSLLTEPDARFSVRAKFERDRSLLRIGS